MTFPGFLGPSLAALLVLLGPGSVLLLLFPQECQEKNPYRHDLFSRLADAVALSIALPALIGLWLAVPGVRLNGWVLAGLYGGCLLALLWTGYKALLGWWRRNRPAFPPLRSWIFPFLAVLGGLSFTALVLAWRFYQLHGMALPVWVDPVHHTLIVRKIMEYGGLPPDLTPYLPLPFFYHYGFHLITAIFAFFAGFTPVQAVFWFGQVINAGVGLSAYRLATAFKSKDEPHSFIPILRGCVAALLVSFVFQMPAYYLTWGRYTLLTGLLVAGPTLAAAYEFWENPKSLATGIRFLVLFTGLFLVHYEAFILLGMFLFVLGVAGVLQALSRKDWRFLPWELVLLSLLGLALVIPWIGQVLTHTAPSAQVQVVLPKGTNLLAEITSPDNWNYLIYLWGPRRNYIMLALSAVGALFALRRRSMRTLVAWGVLLLLFSLPWGLRLGPFRPDLFNIVIFFPAAIISGDLLVSTGEALGMFWRPWVAWAAVALVVASLVGWGARETADIINPVTVFATQSDVAALNWVQDHTPPTARFYINNVLWQYTTNRGVDGGFWLMPYTGRFSLVPTSMYDQGSRDYAKIINDWAKRSQKLTGCTADFWSLVKDAGLTHIYLHQGVGQLQPEMLKACSGVQIIYQKAGVFIYEIQQTP